MLHQSDALSGLCLGALTSLQNAYFMILATGLYINACAKGEELIPQTWDMYYEKCVFRKQFGHCDLHLLDGASWSFSGTSPVFPS